MGKVAGHSTPLGGLSIVWVYRVSLARSRLPNEQVSVMGNVVSAPPSFPTVKLESKTAEPFGEPAW